MTMTKDDAIIVRIPKATKRKLQEMAKKEQRSLSNLIVVLLTQSIETKREAA
jgi:predicted HicB family RNase H-like nuclease